MTILCATDFSPCSEAATDLARVMAGRLGDSLCLVHVLEVPPPEMPPLVVPGMPIGPSSWEGPMMRAAEARLAETAKELSRAGIKVETRVLVGVGRASDQLLEFAGTLAPGLIVVGTHGRKGAAQFFLGSVAEQIVRKAVCPVLVTRAGIDIGRWKKPDPLRLMIVAGGSGSVPAAFSWGVAFANQIPGDLTVVRLYWPPEEATRYGVEHAWLGDKGHPALMLLLARDLESELPPRSENKGPHVRFRVVERHAADAVVAEAAELEADVIVVGADAGKRHAAYGITVSPVEVVRAASVPVVCMPAVGEAVPTSIASVRSILVATDLTATSREAIAPAYGILAAGGGRIELCFVNAKERTDDIMDLSSPPLTESQRAEVEAKLRALVPPDAPGLGIATGISVLEGSSVEGALLQAAERLNVDLIALASHGRAGLKRAVLGSVAEEVARHSSKPVLIIHARDRAGAHPLEKP